MPQSAVNSLAERVVWALPPTATGGLARLALERARWAGLNIASLTREMGLREELTIDSEQRLSVRLQVAVLNAVARALGDDALGVRLATEIDLRQTGLL